MEGGNRGDGGAREDAGSREQPAHRKGPDSFIAGPTATLRSLAGSGESMADGRRMGKARAQTPPSPSQRPLLKRADGGQWVPRENI